MGGRTVWHSTTAMRQEAFLGMRMVVVGVMIMVRVTMTIVVMIIKLIMAGGRSVV